LLDVHADALQMSIVNSADSPYRGAVWMEVIRALLPL